MTRTNWLTLLFLFGATGVWCSFEVRAIMETRGGLVRFHPLVLLAVPAGSIMSTFILVIAFLRKSILLGVLSLLPVVALALPVFFAYDLGILGWSREIGLHARENQAAINSVDFSLENFDEVPYKDHERMVQVPGFIWSNSDTMVAAKNGVFFCFTVDGVPHIYICPLMNGARGVAWVTSTAKIDKESGIRYEYTGVANWYIWILSA